ncbi:Protein GrpE [Paraconexibacter sp. AEG42_29]|uniref:Protein GrpE n=1 Tax=Paraconexibacter sp. AEG42_29 TaxID=2997339 RepID=A0AAU7AW11_9ACTN
MSIDPDRPGAGAPAPDEDTEAGQATDDSADVPATPAEPAATADPGPAAPAAEADAQSGPTREQLGEALKQALDTVRGQADETAAATRRADELATIARKQTEMADELHAENRQLRTGEVREAVAPLIRGLARLADDLSRLRAVDGANADLTYLAGQVDELLHDAGVTQLVPQIGDAFDPQTHQAAGSATTDEPHLDRTIAEIRRSGLRRDDGRMLRAAEVVVHRYITPITPADPASPTSTEET